MGLPVRSAGLAPGRPLAVRLYREEPDRVSRRPQLNSQARGAVLWGLGLFALGQLILAVWLDSRFPYDREYAARLERLKRRTGPAAGNPLTLFALGSSRSEWGLQAAKLEKLLGTELGRPVVAINFASGGAGPATAYFNWRRLQRKGFRPDLVLIEVPPMFLKEDHLTAGFELSEKIWPLSRLDWSDLAFFEQYVGAQRPGLRKDWLCNAGVPLYCRRLEWVSKIAPRLLPLDCHFQEPAPLDESGQPIQSEDPPTSEKRQRALKHAWNEHHAPLQTFRLGGQGCEILRRLLASCRKEGVPAALLVMPEGPEFRSWYPVPVWPEIRAWLTGVAAEYGATLLDARDWMPEEDFLDSHHLDGPGPTRFTERLARQEVLPLLRKLFPASE